MKETIQIGRWSYTDQNKSSTSIRIASTEPTEPFEGVSVGEFCAQHHLTIATVRRACPSSDLSLRKGDGIWGWRTHLLRSWGELRIAVLLTSDQDAQGFANLIGLPVKVYGTATKYHRNFQRLGAFVPQN